MPELPEVQTTVDGIRDKTKGLRIVDVWTGYRSDFHANKDNIQNPKYFRFFKKEVVGAKIKDASRRAKNVLVHLSNGKTILIHMKMTGHVLYGKYKKISNDKLLISKNSKPKTKNFSWVAVGPGPLRDDPFNKWIRLVFTLSNGKHLVLSDLRKFAKVTLLDTHTLEESEHLAYSGPEPLDSSFDFDSFRSRLGLRPRAPIKQTLMDHTIIAGIGNIYSDEILWRAGIHPLEKIERIPKPRMRMAFMAMKEVLRKGIDFGGDSMSDYRNILGEKGAFQKQHRAYQRTGERCKKRGCRGIIERVRVAGRSAHFCNKHQMLSSRRA